MEPTKINRIKSQNQQPEWLDDFEAFDQLMVQQSVLQLEASLPYLHTLDPPSKSPHTQNPNVVKALRDIIENHRWPLLRETLVLLHRYGLQLPYILLPPIIQAPSTVKKYIENLPYLVHPEFKDHLETENESILQADAIKTWIERLTFSNNNLTKPTTILRHLTHLITQDEPLPRDLIEKFWKKANTSQKEELIKRLKDVRQTETILTPFLQTRSHSLSQIIIWKLSRCDGSFKSILNAWVTLNCLQPDAHDQIQNSKVFKHNDVIQGFEFDLTFSLLIQCLSPEMLEEIKQKNTGLFSIIHKDHVMDLILQSMIHEQISEPVRTLKYINNISVTQVLSAIQLVSPKYYNEFLGLTIHQRLFKAEKIVELITSCQHFFTTKISSLIINWLKTELIDDTQLAAIVIDEIAYRSDPIIYQDILLLSEQYYIQNSPIKSTLETAINDLKKRIVLRNALRSVSNK